MFGIIIPQRNSYQHPVGCTIRMHPSKLYTYIHNNFIYIHREVRNTNEGYIDSYTNKKTIKPFPDNVWASVLVSYPNYYLSHPRLCE